jgi:hypothetical protein
MRNNFLRIVTQSGVLHYINVHHIVDIYTDINGNTAINTVNGIIDSNDTVIEIIERIYKNQWNVETTNTINNTK